jgi:mono/diheme cytochrome c family protein
MARHWLGLGALCMFLALDSRTVPAQSKAKTSAKTKAAPCVDSTTRSGVYTAAQAARGKDIYAGNCRSCHTPETHTGATFNAIWNRRPLADLYSFIRERMPKNDPGSLSDQEYADVLAYVLLMNRMPAGRVELSSDSSALKGIRIQIGKLR